MTTLGQFYDKLNAHDWTYSYSDDGQQYRRGDEQRREIVRIAKESPQHQALYETMRTYFLVNMQRGAKPERPTSEP